VAALLAFGWAIRSSSLLPFALISAMMIGVIATLLARRSRNRRRRGLLLVVWSEAPVRAAEPRRLSGELNPGGYCRFCGSPREAGTKRCVHCDTEVALARSGTPGR
jgi:hypothetical protein